MIEVQLDEAARSDEHKRELIIRELASHPDVTLDTVIRVLNSPMKGRWRMAVRVIRAIGYPRNAPAIRVLMDHVGDKNSVAWKEAIQALVEIGPQVVVPHLIQFLWDRESHQYWGEDVEGICEMLATVDREFALPCGPLLSYILGQDNLPPTDLDKGYLLDVLEKIGLECAQYALPTLIALIQKEGSSEVGRQARRLMASFDKEALEPYQLLLASLEEPRGEGG
jgi:hypothetical protein